VQSGQARGIAVLSSKRSPLAPDVPTMSEAGVPVSMSIPGLEFSRRPRPAGSGRQTTRRYPRSLPGLKERFEKSGGEVWDLANDKLDAFVVSEHENWTKLIREAGIKLD